GYRLVRPIGRGSMGQVYLAHDTLLDRSVAVKFIAAVDPNPEQRERFFLEARAFARLQHPNVVTIYRVGEALGQPYLISENVAGLLARTSSPPVSATLPGAVMGTPLYMAPEVWRGEPATFRSDIYSLGALLYHLCSGHPPHDRGQMQDLRTAVLDSDARPLAEACAVEPRFAAAIDRCLRRDASERFSSADELREAFDQLGAA